MKKNLLIFCLLFLCGFSNCENFRHASLVILGSGCAGLEAALFAARDKVENIIVITGPTIGGLLTGSYEVENWPGIDRKSGAAIMEICLEKVRLRGVELLEDSAIAVDFSQRPFIITTEENGAIHADAVIIATGSSPKMLGIPGEQEYWGAGVSSCAICDGFLYEGLDVAIAGGGDSAITEALHLVHHARTVTVFVRRPIMRASLSAQDKLADYENQIFIEYNKEIIEVIGDGVTVNTLVIHDITTGELQKRLFNGLFLAIGHTPNTQIFSEWLPLDDDGTIMLAGRSQKTIIPGVFVAGDVADNRFRQAAIAAGSGAQAGFEACEFLRYAETVR